MEKELNKRSVLKIFFIIFFIVLLFFVFAFKNDVFNVNSWILDKDIVYVPTRATAFFKHDILSIDAFNCWKFKLNDEEVACLDTDIQKNENWSEYPVFAGLKMEWFTEQSFRGFNEQESYICIYDCKNEKVISYSDMYSTSAWIICIYDKYNSDYYCIYMTS